MQAGRIDGATALSNNMFGMVSERRGASVAKEIMLGSAESWLEPHVLLRWLGLWAAGGGPFWILSFCVRFRAPGTSIWKFPIFIYDFKSGRKMLQLQQPRLQPLELRRQALPQALPL
jgi:hypothetical protein